MDIVVGVVAILGAAFVALAGIGVVRFGDLYARMHAATKASTIGIGLIGVAGALAIQHGAAKILLAVVVIFITAPSAAHFIGRAAYRAKNVELRLDGADEFAALFEDRDAPV